MNGKRRQDQDHGTDETPHKGNPGRHLEVARLIYAAQPAFISTAMATAGVYSQASHDTARNQALQPPNDGIQQRRDPYDLPVAPLHNARPKGDYQVHGSEEQGCPYQGEAPDVIRVVEVVRHRGAYGERPVERRPWRCFIARRRCAAGARDEAAHSEFNPGA
jgi:hypothetical protein